MSNGQPTKYGWPAGYSYRIVQRHFDVMKERKAISALHLAHALEQGPALAKAVQQLKERP